MKPIFLSLGLVLLSSAACQHKAIEDDPSAVQDFSALEQFAIGEVYSAFPTRALVDKIETMPSDDEHTLVRVEMTGAPQARGIYEVHITPLEDSSFKLEKLEKLQ